MSIKNIILPICCGAISVAAMQIGISIKMHYVFSGFLTLLLPLIFAFFYINLEIAIKIKYLIFTVVASLIALLPDFYLLTTNVLSYDFPIANKQLFLPITSLYGLIAWLVVIYYPIITSSSLLRTNFSIFQTTLITTCIYSIFSSAAEQIGILAQWWHYNLDNKIFYEFPYFVIARYILMLFTLPIFSILIERYNSYKGAVALGALYGVWTAVATAIAYYITV